MARLRTEDYTQIKADGSRLGTFVESYSAAVDKVYSISNELTTDSWAGPKCSEYVSAVEEFRTVLTELKTSLEEFATGIIAIGESLEEIENS